MARLQNPLPIAFSPVQHSRVCFVLAVILFLLAAGRSSGMSPPIITSISALGLVFAVLGIAPLVMHALQHKPK